MIEKGLGQRLGALATCSVAMAAEGCPHLLVHRTTSRSSGKHVIALARF